MCDNKFLILSVSSTPWLKRQVANGFISSLKFFTDNNLLISYLRLSHSLTSFVHSVTGEAGFHSRKNLFRLVMQEQEHDTALKTVVICQCE